MLRTQGITRTKVNGKCLNLISKQKKEKIMCLKNKNIKTKNKNTRYAKLTWKQTFIMLTYANMNMKITWQGYGVRLCLKLMLNILKEMKVPILILYPFEDLAQGSFQRGFYVGIE